MTKIVKSPRLVTAAVDLKADRGQRTENRRQKTENREQRTENSKLSTIASRQCLLSIFCPLSSALCLLFSVFSSGPLQAQASRLPSPQGTDIFRRVLQDSFYVTPLTTLSALEKEPENKVLIVLGETAVLEKVPGGLEGFIRAGGAALIATDRSTGRQGGNALRPFGVSVDGRLLHALQGAYKGLPDCVPVEFANSGVIFKPSPDSFGVATNKPSYLKLKIPGPKIQASFPRGCRFEDGRTSRDPLPFAATGEIGNGRILVLSDHSVFINGMLWQNDNQNLDFLDTCLEWLLDKKRTEVLFFDEGFPNSHFDVPLKDLPPPPLPPLEVILRSVNRGLKGLEEENRFNDSLANLSTRLGIPQYLGILAVVLTIGLGLVGLSLLSQARFRAERDLPHLATDLARQQAHAPALEQRHAAMRREGNFYETARTLACHFFEADCGLDVLAAALGDEAKSAGPRVRASGNPWYRWNARRRVSRLWRLATGNLPARVSRRQLLHLARGVDRLNADRASGRLGIELYDHQDRNQE
jgi:hypothetical protein